MVFADWLDDRGDPRGQWVRDPEIWECMKRDAHNPIDELIIRKCWHLLEQIGWEAVPQLLAVVRQQSEEAIHAAKTLARIAPELRDVGRNALLGLQDSPKASVRQLTAIALVSIG